MHRISPGDDTQCGDHQDGREQEEQYRFEIHSILLDLLPIGRVFSARLGDFRFVLVADGEQHRFGVVQIAALLAVKFEDMGFDDGIHRTRLPRKSRRRCT